jgi:hypothetical protein
MPLIPGTVSINGAGAASGAGLSKELYDALAAATGMSPGAHPGNVPGAQQQLAVLANVIGQVVVAHWLANATITVPLGIAVTVAGSATTQTGATTAAAVAVLT